MFFKLKLFSFWCVMPQMDSITFTLVVTTVTFFYVGYFLFLSSDWLILILFWFKVTIRYQNFVKVRTWVLLQGLNSFKKLILWF